MIATCICGSVEIEVVGTPIASVVCYCNDCQEGARNIEALPGAGTTATEGVQPRLCRSHGP